MVSVKTQQTDQIRLGHHITQAERIKQPSEVSDLFICCPVSTSHINRLLQGQPE